jgi:uncharacterized protein (TIGR02271 family)
VHARCSLLEARGDTKDQNTSRGTVREGMQVKDINGNKLGNVGAVQGNSFVVKKGFFFPTDYTIPTTAVSSVDEDTVYLTVTEHDALDQRETWGSTVVTNSVAADSSTSTTATGDLAEDPAPFVHEQDSPRTHLNDDDTIRVALAEEELSASARAVDRSEVRIEKTIVSEERSLDVPLTKEEVHVTRHVVDRPVATGEDLFTGGTIEVPISGEEGVEIEKRAHVVEELEIEKQAVTHTQRVGDTIRREEVQVDDSSVTSDAAADSIPSISRNRPTTRQ